MDNAPVRPTRSLPSGLDSPDDIVLYLRNFLVIHACTALRKKHGLTLHDMEDIFADAMGKMLDQLRSGNGPPRPSVAWANTILENTIRDHFRHQSVRKDHRKAVAQHHQQELDARAVIKPIDAVNQNRALARATEQLRDQHPDQAKAVELRSRDLTVPEIAKTMEVSLRNCKNIFFTILPSFAEELYNSNLHGICCGSG
jgi:RNA polymerase sigma factor (sigma-70 family)